NLVEAKEKPAGSTENRWKQLRQGARNIAGDSWQIAVTAHLLIQSRVGDLEFAKLTPEGYEDIDCYSQGGAITLVQVKEKGAGAGRMAAGDIAEVLVHAFQGER